MQARVLVVDDTDHIRQVLADMLELDGFDVVGTAPDGETALTMAVATDPHVVIMDLRMPGMDGLETTRRLLESRPGQRVVLYTAYLDSRVEEQARAAGAALCLEKVGGLPRLERELHRMTLGIVGPGAA